MKPETNIEKKLWVATAALFLFFTMLWTCSCSTTECLTIPHPNDYKIVWCDNKYIYVETIEKDTIKIRNVDEICCFVGDYMILKEEFRHAFTKK